MADQIITTGLQAVPLVTQHYRKVWDPIHHKVKKMKGEIDEPDPAIQDHRTPEEKGYVLRRKSEVASDEEIVEHVRHRGQVKARRPGRPAMNRRSSSMDDARNGNRPRGYAGGYESEGSVPPRSRTRARSESDNKSRKRSNSSSSTASSELASSTDEDNQIKKAQRKKWLTAALASVATIHAASKVYSSIEAHDKRVEEVRQGKISPEEAHKKQRNARWQDAAAIGIAALGIKGAISEWNELQEEHSHHKEMMQKKEEHHKKRLEKMRREKAKDGHGYYKGRDGDWYYAGDEKQGSERSMSQSQRLDGPRNGERRMLEGPSRSRARSAYDDGYTDYRNGDGRSRSRYTEKTRQSSRHNDGYDDDY